MRVPSTVFFVSGVLLVATTVASAQSLADVARKEEERRKAIKATAKVYTNKDLSEVPPATTPVSGTPAGTESTGSSASSASGSAATKDDKGTKDDSRGQAYWAGRVKVAKDALDHDSTFVDALQSRVNALTTDFVNRDDPIQRSTIERDRQKALSELERMKQKVVEDRKAIADIEEEARRTGVPAGWLR